MHTSKHFTVLTSERVLSIIFILHTNQSDETPKQDTVIHVDIAQQHSAPVSFPFIQCQFGSD